MVALLNVAIVVFFEARLESFAPQLRDYAELKIEEAFGETFIVSIGSLVGGIFHPFVLNDCTIKDLKGNAIVPSVNIDSIITDYRIWDLFKRRKGSVLSLTGKPNIDIKYSSKDKSISGFARLNGEIDDADVRGYLKYLEKERIDYVGKIKKGSLFVLALDTKNGILNLEGSISTDRYLTMNVKLSHFRLYDFDIVCDATTKNAFFMESGNPKRGYIEGEIETESLILNYKQFSNLKASYTIDSHGILNISMLDIGKDFKICGKVGLIEPHIMEIVIMANNVNLSRVLSIVNPKGASYMTGTMNGKFNLAGTFRNPRLNARFDVRHGKLTDVDFEHLNATLKGEGPIIRIEDSRITREGGYFVLTGEIDLSKAGSGDMFEGVKLATSDAAIIWDGWDTMRMRDTQELRMKKRMSEEVGLSFKKYITDERIDESLRDTDQYEIDYNLNPSESLKFKVGQDQDFFGLEHRNKF